MITKIIETSPLKQRMQSLRFRLQSMRPIVPASLMDMVSLNINLLNYFSDKKYDPVTKKEVSEQKKTQGFASVYGFGCFNNTYYMSMELMGPSLSDLFNFCGR